MTAFYIISAVWLPIVLAIQIPESANRTENFILLRCRNNTDNDTTSLIENQLNEFHPFYNLSTVDIQNFCPATKNKLLELMKKLSLDIVPCFTNSDERFFPEFLNVGFGKFMDFLCGNRTFEIFFSPQGNDCREALTVHKSARNQTASCSKQIHEIFKGVIKYENVCNELKIAEKCFGSTIATTCRHFRAYEMLNTKFFNAISKPCNGADGFRANLWCCFVSSIIFLVTYRKQN